MTSVEVLPKSQRRSPSEDTTASGGGGEGSVSTTGSGGGGGGIGVVSTGGGSGGDGSGTEDDSDDDEGASDDDDPVDNTDDGEESGATTEEKEPPTIVEEPSNDSVGKQESQTGSESEETENDDRDEEPQIGEITVITDAWDSVGWGIEPVLKKLEVEFGVSLDISYELLPPRDLDIVDYEVAAERYEMPYAQLEGLPETSRLSTEALGVAQEQGQELFREYLRRLRIAALVEGRDIEDKDLLLNLAGEIGLDVDQLRKHWAEVDTEQLTEVDTTPQMWVSAGDLEIPKSGHIEFEPTYFAFVGNNVMPAGVPQPLTDFITEYDLATTVEVMKALDTERAQLKNSEKVQQVCLGVGEFWEVI
ncbi:DsbA family protein [Halospeciosus flavus]|uniref:DsbA family protein n=1 Tax=Halospeciosus flavus TaxID=3032283 RepID=A0ABD5ZA15_9EURY|nr:DsbA family protein [Halospeciosus flavus]